MEIPAPRVQFLPALTLFLLSPLIGEYLLGNMGIDMLWLMVLLAPLYGAGALLVRELAIRFRGGWPAVFLLGLAYALIEEAFVTQSLFNPNYLGMRLLDYGYLAPLGIGGWWTVFVLGLHAIWSVAASVALAEALWPRRAAEPWLRGWALGVAGIVLVAGSVAVSRAAGGPQFNASPLQFAAAGTVVALLVAAAWLAGRMRTAEASGQTVAPLAAGAASFVLLSLFMVTTMAMEAVPATPNVAAMLAILVILALLVLRWSRKAGWGPRHKLALTAGALLTYGWWSLVLPATVTGASPTVDLIGNLVFITGAVALLALAHRRIAKAQIST